MASYLDLGLRPMRTGGPMSRLQFTRRIGHHHDTYVVAVSLLCEMMV